MGAPEWVDVFSIEDGDIELLLYARGWSTKGNHGNVKSLKRNEQEPARFTMSYFRLRRLQSLGGRNQHILK